MTDAVIVATTRSPIGRAFKGSLVSMRPDDLLVQVIRALLDRVPGLDPTEVEDLIIGTGSPCGEQGYNIARVAAVLAGMVGVPGTTVNRYCSSSLQTIRMAAHAIRAEEGDVFLAGGVECVSRYAGGKPDADALGFENPRFSASMARTAARADDGVDPWQPGELPDAYIAMGQTAENVSQIEGISREEMDQFAYTSQERAARAIADGFFAEEITPVVLPDGTTVDADDCPRPSTTLEGLAQLRPAFRPHGAVTAGNSCPLNDGAAAVLVMSDRRAGELGIRPLARIVASAVSALDPEIMGLGPVGASRCALARAGMTMDDVDLVEINEAFAAQVIPAMRHLGIPHEKLNVHGGAIALGHPFGMTGARIMTTLLHGLERRDGVVGLETMCVGGGQGMAMIVERL
jgi:acetyl-CoA C-acetyltransferase